MVDAIHPETRMHDQFNIRRVQNAFRRDSLLSTAPMTTPLLNQPGEVNYDKGGSVIRMFEHTIGNDLFRAALHRYLVDK